MSIAKYVTLEVIGPAAANLGPNAVHTFDVQGGSLGRASDNDWVINDPYVSRYQARIGYLGGKFYLAPDPQASAPMFFNSSEHQLLAPEKYPLRAGDRIVIDEVLIQIGLSLDAPVEVPAPDREIPAPGTVGPFEQTYPSGRNPDDPTDREFSGRFSPGFPAHPETSAYPGEHSTSEARNCALHDYVAPPMAAPAIPADWYLRQESGQKHSPTSESSTAASVGDLASFLRGAGIEERNLTTEVMTSLGTIMRIVIQGVVEIIHARDEIRREFRVPVTLAKPRENNPLKLSVNAEDALHNILVKRNEAYLPAPEAFQEAFDDLRKHQLAMLKGMRAGYENVISRFKPDRLEKSFKAQDTEGGFMGKPGRSKLWERYRDWFDRTTEDDDECFRLLFGEAFAKAYEEELLRLTSAPRQRLPPS